MPGAWKYEVVHEGEEVILRVDCEHVLRFPSLEDDAIYMAKTVELLTEVGEVTKIVFHQKRNVEYDYAQTMLMVELARTFNTLTRQKEYFSREALSLGGKCMKSVDKRYTTIQMIIFRHIKEDPISAFVELHRLIRMERIRLQKLLDDKDIECTKRYISILSYLENMLAKMQLITLAKPYLGGHKLWQRDIYREIFHPIIKPDFMFTKLMANYPPDGEEVDNYTVGDETEITVFEFKDKVMHLYHMMPPEFKLNEDKYDLLDLARNIMTEHKPTRQEFINPQRMRSVFHHVGHDLLEELASYRGIKIKEKELQLLTDILVRYTVGFGLIEVLLSDPKIQDISVNSPLGRIPLFIVHGDYSDCTTNIMPTMPESESWASKLRLISGRPLDEANPILDTELHLPMAMARVSVITRPLDPTGIAFSFRRHRSKPWTLPLFVHNKMITPLAAGILSFIIDGTRTMLIAGTRSSGKSSFLAAIMIEIMRRSRIITIEDTLELPTDAMRELGFNILSMKVASALAKGSSEMSASDGIRSTLRLGDSALIVGEVRSKEAVALYEAMRVGAAANVVAGTIHGDSPYGVYDRVVNDIGVPKTSFKATDILIIANPIKSADGIHRFRRITQITEVRKHWENDPLLEGGFVDLMKYDSRKDKLEITDDLINGDSDVLKAIAANIPDFAGNWDALWQNIELRGKLKELQIKYALKAKNLDLLEAAFTIKCNDKFHILSGKVKEQVGSLDSKMIQTEWEAWIKREIKKQGK